MQCIPGLMCGLFTQLSDCKRKTFFADICFYRRELARSHEPLLNSCATSGLSCLVKRDVILGFKGKPLRDLDVNGVGHSLLFLV